MKLRYLLLGRKPVTSLDSIFKNRNITLSTKMHRVKAVVFLVAIYRCENWTTKQIECQRMDAFELWYWRRLLRVPRTSRRSNQSILNETKPWILIGRTDAETPVVWPLDMKSQLNGKDPVAGKDWGQEEREATEDERVGWHHQLNGHKFEQTPGDSEGQWSLVCCSLWDPKESDMMSNWTSTTKHWSSVLKQH